MRNWLENNDLQHKKSRTDQNLRKSWKKVKKDDDFILLMNKHLWTKNLVKKNYLAISPISVIM